MTECEVCGMPTPDDPVEEDWGSAPDEGGPDAVIMWFCPECMEKWG